MLIDIISDNICPWCYIGKRKLEAALARRPGLEVELNWRCFQLNPEMPPGGMDRKTYLEAKFGGPAGAAEVYDRIAEAGRLVGLDFHFDDIRKVPNTLDSHRLIRWARSAGVQDAVVEALFRANFTDGKDIGDRDVLRALAEDCGMDGGIVADMLESGVDLDHVEAEDQLARRMGVSGVPFFVFDQKYALSGAQDPDAFLQVFDRIEAEKRQAPEASAKS